MNELTIRPYHGRDEAALLTLWNQALTHDPISASVFRTQVLLDPNFRPEGLLLAEQDGELAGFVLALTRQTPFFQQGLEPGLAWITAFGVHPDRRRQGVARRLFATALAPLAGRKVLISPYAPNYFVPGVDSDAYPAALAFLHAEGWEPVSHPISMHADLTGFQIPEEIRQLERRLAGEQGITIRPVQPGDLPALMPFITQHFGWDWRRFAQEYLLELFGPGSDQVYFLVAVQGERILGYCQQRRERFGPFGVAPEMRRSGIGRVLLFRCLAGMRARGFHCAWFLWTGKDAARLYSLAGFQTARQFVVLRRDLTAPDAMGEYDV